MDRASRSCEDARVKLKRLSIPAALAVTQLIAAGCSTPSNQDAGIDSAPVACGPVVQPDGGVQCVGATMETFCVGRLSTCTVVAGDASTQCCELVG